MAGRQMNALTLTEVEKSELTALASRPKIAPALAQRAQIVLSCADGLDNRTIAQRLDVHAVTVDKWRRRFLAHRVKGLRDEPRTGAPRTIEDEQIKAVITRTLEQQPEGATHWSSRGMARDTGLSVSTVQRIWRAYGLTPHRQETFRLSADPDFFPRVRDLVGLYLSPPEHAMVLCVDETSQIQAPERSQAVFPMRPGEFGRRSHDQVRFDTTSLLAALEVVTGKVIGEFHPRHRAAQFRQFLDEIEAAIPVGLGVHLVLGNYAMHKTALIRNWLASRPRWHVHLSPTSSFWLNEVRRFCALLTEKQIRDGVRCSVEELEATINAFLDQHEADPKPFRWVTSATMPWPPSCPCNAAST